MKPSPAAALPDPVEKHAAVYRRHAHPLAPLPSGIDPKLRPLSGIRAVIFDIYGTLMISASGDLSLVPKAHGDAVMREALARVGLMEAAAGRDLDRLFRRAIAHAREVRAAEGIEYPEVEIREVWSSFLNGLALDGVPPVRLSPAVLEELAVHHECRFNPVWPMPHLCETLAHLRGKNLLFGIVSNAQFYTRSLFPAFLGQPLEQLGFALECCIFSYREREGKPSLAPYRKLLNRLAARDIRPSEILFVGNDLRNDIWPTSQLGLRTALFAGDARSLRRREDDPRLREVEPDIVLTDLYQLTQVVNPE